MSNIDPVKESSVLCNALGHYLDTVREYRRSLKASPTRQKLLAEADAHAEDVINTIAILKHRVELGARLTKPMTLNPADHQP